MLNERSNLRDLLNDILLGVRNSDYKPLSKKSLIKRVDKLDKQEIIRFQKLIADSVMPMREVSLGTVPLPIDDRTPSSLPTAVQPGGEGSAGSLYSGRVLTGSQPTGTGPGSGGTTGGSGR